MPTLDSLPPRLMVLSQNRYSCPANLPSFTNLFDEVMFMAYRYTIEQRIHTLAKNFVGIESGSEDKFEADGVTFQRWSQDMSETWKNPYWTATAEIDGASFLVAWQSLWDRLSKSVPRICTVSQCYTEFLGQPLFIVRADLNLAFGRWTFQRGDNGLMFWAAQLKAFNLLMDDPRIPDEFFWYWSDATNSTGYASKLMLMLSAVETLVNEPAINGRPQKDYTKLEAILGPELKKEFWGEKGDSFDALRHRLAHGRYFAPRNAKKDYMNLLHQKVIAYLNDTILGEKLITEDITQPQRHPTESRDESHFYLRARTNAPLTLRSVAIDLDKSFENPENYEYVEMPDDF